MNLIKKKCIPCEGGVKPFTKSEANKYLKHIKDWKISGKKLVKQIVFKDFMHLIKFVNKLAVLAEREGHHPDFTVHYRKLHLVLLLQQHLGSLKCCLYAALQETLQSLENQKELVRKCPPAACTREPS